MDKFSRLSDFLDEYYALIRKSNEMKQSWEGNDECDRAISDPGLQYQCDTDISEKEYDIIHECKNIIENHDLFNS